MGLDVNEVGEKVNEFRFGLGTVQLAEQLHRFADAIINDRVLPQTCSLTSVAKPEEWVRHTLTIEFCERIKA